jgi:two-component system, OmpR family, response regulator
MRALVVEDEIGVAHGVRATLEAEGLAVDLAGDGQAGLAMGLAAAYDLIVLDIMLPALNGYRVCTALREAAVAAPILMLTAKTGEYDEAQGLHLGADDYLRKPFSMVVLLARVRALLRRPGYGEANFAVEDLRLDPRRRRCWRGSREVRLTAREVQVLAFLLSRRGQTVAKAELLDGVWGEDFTGDPNIVEVYVGRLRRKVDTAFDRDIIETVRGVGYRIRGAGEAA